MGYWPLRTLCSEARTRNRVIQFGKQRKGIGAHERSVGSGTEGEQADREKLGGRVFQAEACGGPEGAVEQELGTRLPEEVRVVAVEETQDTIYLVLPGTPMAGTEGGALSDQQLESVAGGWDPDTAGQITCQIGCL
jgi:hypothetical protein